MSLMSKYRPAGSALGVLLIGGAVLLGACSSSPSSTTTTSSSSSTPSSSTGGTGGATTTSSSSSSGGSSISSIESKLKGSSSATYDAQYTITGSSSLSSLELAAQPPSTFAFDATTSTGKSEIFGDASKTTSCTENTGATTWTCADLGSGLSGITNSFYIFTGKYWSGLLATATSEGATTSSMSVGGVASDCVTYSPSSAVDGEVCVSQSSGVLTYVKDLKTGTTFSLTSYSASPPASLFQAPAGATVNTLPPGVTLPAGA
jgi:hypothetical protein